MAAYRHVRPALLCFSVAAIVFLSGCSAEPVPPPVKLTLWHYYNGAQKQMFDELVAEFNAGAGNDAGVSVEAYSQGTVDELSGKVIDAIDCKVGAGQVPDIFAAYADTAYEIYGRGQAVDLKQYLSEDDLARFVPAYLSEGAFEDGLLMILPVAKSTELLLLNKTDWDAFARETDASDAELATWEGIRRLSRAYYEWTDAKTEAPNDGKAFFGRDALANHMIIGALQLGDELLKAQAGTVALTLNKSTIRRLWDSYYVPYISGHYAAIGRFRSDDAKTGDIIALVGATSGVLYFPREVTRPDASTYPIEAAAYPLPVFEGGAPCAVQQGAGMAVVKSTAARERAAALFLNWFTQPEQNMRFCLGTGYLPVAAVASTREALDRFLAQSNLDVSPLMKEALHVGADTVQHSRLYTTKAFRCGSRARAVLADFMQQQADADRIKVRGLVATGLPYEQALARFDCDEHFDTWYASFSEALNAAVFDYPLEVRP
ncbi:MAG: extracellular solute-binding protein [Christensenellaceae bacterium]|nr:extracellular solute-binding protein [Christensenellaceae bacterium]